MSTRTGLALAISECALGVYRDALAGRDRQSPPDRATARTAARELRASGLTVADIASALALSEGAVAELLGEAP